MMGALGKVVTDDDTCVPEKRGHDCCVSRRIADVRFIKARKSGRLAKRAELVR
jgi:hypothetical protein